MNTRRERREFRIMKNRLKRLKKKLLRELEAMIKDPRYQKVIPDPSAVQIETIGGNRS